MFEYYLGALNPNNGRLFQREMKVSTKFSLETTSETVWFTNSPIGKEQVPKMLPLLCEAAGCDRLTNHSLRATALSALNRAGFTDTTVQSVSGHKNASSLVSYNRTTEVQQMRMAISIGQGEFQFWFLLFLFGMLDRIIASNKAVQGVIAIGEE